jgi:RNase P/RNase MRP subunit p29
MFFVANHQLVVKSSCPPLVGIEGIVILETKNAFQVITVSDDVKSKSFFRCEQ